VLTAEDDSIISNDEIDLLINAITSNAATDEENALGHLTRRKLQTLVPTWPIWNDAEKKQPNQMHDLGMYGEPCSRPTNSKYIIFRPHWQYKVKTCGKRRARFCCDGSKRAAPLLHTLVGSYSSCIEVPILRLFLALSTAFKYVVYADDARDAYAHSPGPQFPTFLSIDHAFSDWYYDRFKISLAPDKIVPVCRALQGHPESGVLWETHINKILSDLQFYSTTHERNIYVSYNYVWSRTCTPMSSSR
jgi:hypothetical protein